MCTSNSLACNSSCNTHVRVHLYTLHVTRRQESCQEQYLTCEHLRERRIKIFPFTIQIQSFYNSPRENENQENILSFNTFVHNLLYMFDFLDCQLLLREASTLFCTCSILSAHRFQFMIHLPTFVRELEMEGVISE